MSPLGWKVVRLAASLRMNIAFKDSNANVRVCGWKSGRKSRAGVGGCIVDACIESSLY